MGALEIEDLYESDSSDNEENHSRLINSVSQLDSTQRVKPAQRKEVASEVSEYNLNEGSSGRKNIVKVKELARVLGKKSDHARITKKIANVTKKSKTLPTPLPKPTEERLKRSVGFENVKKQLGRWDAIVARNSLKDTISFPLNNNSMKMQKTNEFLSKFKTKTPLEEEIAKVLKQDNEEEKETEDNEFPLTLEEMRERRKELAQLRAKLSYRQSKAQRQSRIKSKKYHRILKREKLRQQLKEFEILQKTDPEAALKKLSELDKTRAQERASLRHRNTGQWAKNLSVRAKYDVETRKILAEQLKVSRELTQKVSQLDSSEDEEATNVVTPEIQVLSQTTDTSTNNPWTLDVAKEVQDFVTGYKKFWNEKNKEILQNNTDKNENRNIDKNDTNDKTTQSFNEIQNEETSKIVEGIQEASHQPKVKIVAKPEITSSSSPSKKRKATTKNKTCVSIHPTSGVWIVTTESEEHGNKTDKKQKAKDMDTLFEDLNDKLMKNAQKKISRIERNLKRNKRKKNNVEREKSDEEFDLSLKNITVPERPDMDVGLLEGEPEEIALRTSSVNTVVSERKNEAEAAIDPKNFIQIKPKRLRTQLPENITGEEDAVDDEKAQEKIIEEAFGDDDVIAEFREMKEEEAKSSKVEIQTSLPGWGEWGGTGIKPNPKKKRRLVLNLPPRKDKLKKDVIINENENPKLKDHLVKEVPHPFKSVDAFEANIRAPVGRDWVPETAHQKLIQKQVLTKLGTVIEPMSEEEIVNLKKAPKSPYQGKKKKLN